MSFLTKSAAYVSTPPRNELYGLAYARSIIDNMGEITGRGEISFYKRIGGYDVIAAIVDDLFALMRADSRFIRFGVGRSIDSVPISAWTKRC
jgi:hypothetical protein